MAWQQQQQQDTKSSISGGTSSGQRSKFGSIDLSLWNENANANSNNSISGLVGVPGGSISGFNGSLGDIIAGMISNGSIDLSNINEQRRDSILKFVNDSQTYRNSRIPSSELDKRHTTFNHHQQPPSVIADANTKLREDIFSKNQSGSVATINSNAKQGNADPKYKSSKASSSKLNVPEKDHLSPTSSMSSRASGKYNDEPQSPKTSPSSYNSRVQQQQQGQQQQQQQQQQFNYQRPPPPPSMYSQQQILPQPSQRMFDNYQIPGQNQYYNPNYSSPGQFQSLPPNATIRNQPPPAPTQPSANYFSSPQQLSYHQQYLPPSSYQNNQYQQQPSQNQITQEQPLDPMLAKSGNRVNKQSKSKPRKQSQSRKSRSVKSEPSIDPQQNLIPTPTNVDKGGLVTAQQYVKSEDGRPLVGATKIDQLMLVIQAREKGITNTIQQAPDGSILGSPNFSSEKGKDASVLPRPVSLVGGVDKPTKRGSIDSDEGHEEYDDEDGDGEGKNRKRRHKTQQCPHCFKTFTQSTHLEVHIRSHIGLKPFECNYCHKKFTQGGNLRTHLRLHTGEKPFPCDICHRSFNRKGNLAAHKLTHDKLKPFECKLDNCDKSFTQLGNLKSHQNRFHLNTLNSLTQKLAQLSGPALNQLPSEEKELLFYFRDLYKNSNKGIRGRGKQQPTNGNEIPGSPESNQQIPTYTGGSTSPSNMNQFRLQPQSPQHSQQQLQQTLPRQHPSTSGVAGAANVNNTGNAQQFQSIDFMNNQLANTINGYRN
ncbi:uncharacterized protein RJT21DRAFT_121508 [Scheffersomyces amazonensis]|uniref:uncharacterized protein n=1 Tax=Scheffersomyces amazonensis TaxID=1078765 RepID=UPI00315CB60F